MTEFDPYLALRTVALAAVVEDGPEFRVRQIQRWYAREYRLTPLQVRDLPLEHVLYEFYESSYYEMSAERRAEERDELLKTRAERDAEEFRAAQQEIGDAEFRRRTEEEARAQVARREAERRGAKQPSLAGAAKLPQKLPTRPVRDVPLEGRSHREKPPPAPIPEGITLKFGDLPDEVSAAAEALLGRQT